MDLNFFGYILPPKLSRKSLKIAHLGHLSKNSRNPFENDFQFSITLEGQFLLDNYNNMGSWFFFETLSLTQIGPICCWIPA